MFRQCAPAPCSPPLGGSIADSAVRFTPAGKYGGRENKPSGRETRCIRYHPCRAHHKLEWARKLHRIYRASARASYTPGERRLSVRGAMRYCRAVPDSAFRIPHSARARHKPERARKLHRIYRGFCMSALHARRAALICARRYAALPRRS